VVQRNYNDSNILVMEEGECDTIARVPTDDETMPMGIQSDIPRERGGKAEDSELLEENLLNPITKILQSSVGLILEAASHFGASALPLASITSAAPSC
jgi:hypothetical protein